MEALQHLSLLIVEDDPIDQEAIIRSLRNSKVANPIYTATDGLAALDRLRGSNGSEKIPEPRLIILDLNLPRMSGPEFLEEIRDDPELSTSVVFVLTTSADVADMEAAYRKNVAGYIVKQRVGADFMRLVELVDAYWRVVELPTGPL